MKKIIFLWVLVICFSMSFQLISLAQEDGDDDDGYETEDSSSDKDNSQTKRDKDNDCKAKADEAAIAAFNAALATGVCAHQNNPESCAKGYFDAAFNSTLETCLAQSAPDPCKDFTNPADCITPPNVNLHCYWCPSANGSPGCKKNCNNP